MKPIKQCIICGKDFTRLYNNQKCCSPECSEKNRIQRLIDAGVQIGVHNKPPVRQKGFKHSEETRQKMSLAKKGRKLPWLVGNHRIHGDATRNRHPIYHLWSRLKQRCFNPNDKRYDDYGGRGIKMAYEWASNYQSFKNYILDMGWPPPPNHTIDRIDNDGDYAPGNIKWSTPKEQAQNRRWRRWKVRPK